MRGLYRRIEERRKRKRGDAEPQDQLAKDGEPAKIRIQSLR
jgi:hypothetical protein